MTNLDFVTDANPKALYFAGMNLELPDYIESYAIPSVAEINKIATIAFANPVQRLHPIHTKEAAVLSGIYLIGEGMEDSPEMHRVKQAAQVFGVEQDLSSIVQAMVQAIYGMQKSATRSLPAPQYAIVVETPTSEVEGYYPISSDVQLQKSARDLYEDFLQGKFPADWAYAAAKNIVKQAEYMGMPMYMLPERIVTLGTERLPDFDVAEKMAACRKYDGATPEAVDIYTTIAKAAREDRGNLNNYLKLWSDMDMTQGISYKDTFTPQEAFFSGAAVSDIEKMASNVVVVNDVMIPASDFSRLSEYAVANNFRAEIADVIDSAVKLAAFNAPMASKYIDIIDTDNKKRLLKVLMNEQA